MPRSTLIQRPRDPRISWTTREQTILEQVVAGYTSQEIARILHLEVAIVEHNFAGMRRKGRATNRAALVALYLSQRRRV